MAFSVILFDLDGTLLPMEQETFVKAYFKEISRKLSHYGYMPERLIETIWGGTGKMVMNDGSKTNKSVFWSHFVSVYGELSEDDYKLFDDFYNEEFDRIKISCGYTPKSKELIDSLKKINTRLILATNPIFPEAATKRRIAWAGLDPLDFELITTYENSSYCKPSLNYYKEIIEKTVINPKEALMVGNDVSEDMAAKELGMQVFLLTDNLINKENADISEYPHGGFDDLTRFIFK